MTFIAIDYRKRFWSRVLKLDSGCWEWTGGKDGFGYGSFSFRNKSERAHRFSFALHNGQIPRGKCVLHKCDNPPCVNPEHLFLGTRAENNLDKKIKGRSRAPCRLSENDIRCIRALRHWSRFSVREIGKEFNLSIGMVSLICNNKSWKTVQTNFKSL